MLRDKRSLSKGGSTEEQGGRKPSQHPHGRVAGLRAEPWVTSPGHLRASADSEMSGVCGTVVLGLRVCFKPPHLKPTGRWREHQQLAKTPRKGAETMTQHFSPWN